jgi:hypothetical protein
MTTREPGFLGMIEAGMSPQEAWQSIRDEVAANPFTRAIFADLASTPDGRAALDLARQMWARHGLPAPFDDLPEPAAPGPVERCPVHGEPVGGGRACIACDGGVF